MFNVCYNTEKIATDWGKIVITPIPKSNTTEPRDPQSYRGIALSSSIYKIYRSVHNSRLTELSEQNHILVDEQNGFRKHRSTTDHVTALTNLIDTGKRLD